MHPKKARHSQIWRARRTKMESKVNLIAIICIVLLVRAIIDSFLPNKPIRQLTDSIAILQKSVDALQPAKPEKTALLKPTTTKLPEKPTSNLNPISIPNRCQTELKTLVQTRDDFTLHCDESHSTLCKIQGAVLNVAVSSFLYCLSQN